MERHYNIEVENHNYIDTLIENCPNIRDIEFINCLLSSNLNEDMRLKTEYLEKVKQKNENKRQDNKIKLIFS